jgi:two-component system sensor histidine kinase/response regulator
LSVPPKRVLLAEDNPTNQLLVLTHLRRLGYEAQAVQNGNEVLAALQSGRWDAILMDCHMPELDGFDTTRSIRAQQKPSATRIPIIALTANTSTEDRDACLEAGMDDYLTKPIKRQVLEAILARYLGLESA